MGTPVSAGRSPTAWGKGSLPRSRSTRCTIKDAEAFKKLVDKNGMPMFVKAVFPPRKSGDSGKPETR